MLAAGFEKLRMIEWIKTNPVPINSKVAYLNNTREIAVVGIKGSGQTFNSKYDNGTYSYPIYRGVWEGDRFHPTQKPIDLFNDLIEKHSRTEDVVVDPFAGSGTTAISCIKTGRKYICSEADSKFYEQAALRIRSYSPKGEEDFFEAN
jgi:DNA modification methylase